MAKVLGSILVVVIFIIAWPYSLILLLLLIAASVAFWLIRKRKSKQRTEQILGLKDEKPETALFKKKEKQEEWQRREAAFGQMLDGIPSAEIVIAEKPVQPRHVSEAYEVPFTNVTARTNLEKLGNFVSIDVETTGLYPSKSEIIEVAAVRFRNFEAVEKFCTLCYPKHGINEEAKRINGITEEMVEGKPLFGQIAESLQNFIGSDNLVAHNLDFDLKFIVKHGVDVLAEKRKYYDTLELAQRKIKKQRQKWDKELGCYMPADDDYGIADYKLGSLCFWYGIPYYGKHRALADAYVVGTVLKNLAMENREVVSNSDTTSQTPAEQ